MKKDLQFVLLAMLGVFALLAGGFLLERYNFERKEDAQITQLQIIETPITPTKMARTWTWKGADISSILAGWKVDRTKLQAGMPHQEDWFALQASGRSGVIWTRSFNLYHGQAIGDGDITELTPQSLAYFHALLAKTSPSSR